MLIYRNYDLSPEGVLTRQLKREHLMAMFGYTPGIDAQTVWNKYQDRIKVIVFTYTGSDFTSGQIEVKNGQLFEVTKADFQDHSFERDFGHGSQLFMSRKHWLILDKEPVDKSTFEVTPIR